jgi:hypothetical protein
MNCDNGHTFKINSSTLINRTKRSVNTVLCTICNPVGSHTQSGQEIILREFIEQNYNGTLISNYKKSGKEIDIFLPDLKLGFEFNGIYWHNELYKDKNYHLHKTEFFEKCGIKLIHIYQDDWNNKKEIIKSRILNLLGKSTRLYARKCEVREIKDNIIIQSFLYENHLQGYVNSKIKIGLYYNDQLVSLMTFGNLRKAMGQRSCLDTYEMLRFCNKLNYNVVGGASRLFAFFIKRYYPKEVISYADRSWSDGNLYEKLNFDFIEYTRPNYYYVIDGVRKHRFNFRKDKLIKDGFNPTKTEHEIMLDRKIYRIYDSGHLKYKFSNKVSKITL